MKTSETKHTPGPWHTDHETDWGYVRAATGKMVARALVPHDDDYLDECRREKKVPEPTASNARLIAAAPELFRIAEKLLCLTSRAPFDRALCSDTEIDIDELETIVAQVRGETIADVKCNRSIEKIVTSDDLRKVTYTELLEAAEEVLAIGCNGISCSNFTAMNDGMCEHCLITKLKNAVNKAKGETQ